MENKEIKTITAEELKDLIEHYTNVTVINVLSKEYFDNCHIKGSINAPLEHLKVIAKEWNKKRKIITYCASSLCSASEKAYKILLEMGFENVYEYPGGMKEWKEKDFNCTGPCNDDYLK